MKEKKEPTPSTSQIESYEQQAEKIRKNRVVSKKERQPKDRPINRVINFKKDLFDFITANFQSIASGVFACIRLMQQIYERVGEKDPEVIVSQLETLHRLRLYSIRELKGKFTPSEWKFMVESMAGTLVSADMRPNVSIFVAHCEDSASLDCLDAKYGVDMPSFINKLKSLTSAQVDTIYYEIEKFWEHPESNLDEWVLAIA